MLRPGSLRCKECQKAYGSGKRPTISPYKSASNLRGRITWLMRSLSSYTWVSTFTPMGVHTLAKYAAVLESSGLLEVTNVNDKILFFLFSLIPPAPTFQPLASKSDIALAKRVVLSPVSVWVRPGVPRGESVGVPKPS